MYLERFWLLDLLYQEVKGSCGPYSLKSHEDYVNYTHGLMNVAESATIVQ